MHAHRRRERAATPHRQLALSTSAVGLPIPLGRCDSEQGSGDLRCVRPVVAVLAVLSDRGALLTVGTDKLGVAREQLAGAKKVAKPRTL